ncbi:unnamed protein product [Calypogeia fissa]
MTVAYEDAQAKQRSSGSRVIRAGTAQPRGCPQDKERVTIWFKSSRNSSFVSVEALGGVKNDSELESTGRSWAGRGGGRDEREGTSTHVVLSVAVLAGSHLFGVNLLLVS